MTGTELTFEEAAGIIRRRMADPAVNRQGPDCGDPCFREPLVGVAAGDDALWAFFKKDIGEFFQSPEEAFAEAFPDAPAPAARLRVISWVLPQTPGTLAAHKKEKEYPSLPWSRVRHFGEMVNDGLRSHVVEELAARGVRACAPVLLPSFGRRTSAKYLFASSWSERHAAHVAGHGTFGLSDGLITRAGKAHRVGSVVAECALAPTPREYSGHRDWCLFFAKGTCGACAKRCPAGSIRTPEEGGRDKQRCFDYIRGTTQHYVRDHQLGVEVSSCGLCQAGVPCSAGIPKPLLRGAPAASDAASDAGSDTAPGTASADD